jgi:hypothetical protein
MSFTVIGRHIGSVKVLEHPRNLRKFADQGWQLVIHLSMTVFELWLLNRPEVDWKWWNEPGENYGRFSLRQSTHGSPKTVSLPASLPPLFPITSNHSMLHQGAEHHSVWELVDQAAVDPILRSFYLCQLGIWFYTALSCRYVDARHKDYFIMFGHHVVTIALVGGSYWMGCLRVGLLVLLLHDSSDIVADLLKALDFFLLPSLSLSLSLSLPPSLSLSLLQILHRYHAFSLLCVSVVSRTYD